MAKKKNDPVPTTTTGPDPVVVMPTFKVKAFDVLNALEVIQTSCDSHVAILEERIDPSYVLTRLIRRLANAAHAIELLLAERGEGCYPAAKEEDNGE